MNTDRFREQVRSYRTLTGKTQEELAKVLGLNPQVLSHKLHEIRNAHLTHREVKAIVTTLVAVTTYFVTLNLNNLIFILHKLYALRRLALVEEMEKDPNWNTMGNRFKAYQRPQPGEHEPSEWMVMVFSLRKLLRPVVDFVVQLFRSSDPVRKEPDGV